MGKKTKGVIYKLSKNVLSGINPFRFIREYFFSKLRDFLIRKEINALNNNLLPFYHFNIDFYNNYCIINCK